MNKQYKDIIYILLMNNPFDEIKEINTKNSIIEIWVESYGRKKNTFVSGWDIPTKDIKTHIKIIKKRNGCNGSVKNNIIQFQGNITDYVKQYLIEKDIDINNIRIRNYI
jgi:translation initiation factor 1 (eIF-1/SUI1)